MAKIKDVAKLAGVSTATVSHVINNTRFVGEETRRKVLDAIESTGYTPNIHAQNLGARNSWELDSLKEILAEPPTPKSRQIFLELTRAISRGEYPQGEPLPNEAELMRRFGLPRQVIKNALGELQRQGLVEFRAGSGWRIIHEESRATHLFGLLIPGLGQTEIFEPIC
jgi:hypothetical protein